MQYPPIWVSGHPRPKGSWTPVKTKTGIKLRPASSKLTGWSKHAKEAISKQWKLNPIEGAVSCTLNFYIPPPKTVKAKYPITRYSSDVDKLIRSILDCMSNIVYIDDAQVIATKQWARVPMHPNITADPGVWIIVCSVEELN